MYREEKAFESKKLHNTTKVIHKIKYIFLRRKRERMRQIVSILNGFESTILDFIHYTNYTLRI